MAKAYIDTEELLTTLEDYIEYDTFDMYQEEPLINMSFEQLEDIVTSLPTADVVEVVHGEWVDDTGQLDSVKQYKCSNCGKKPIVNMNWVTILSNYCPDCGTKMDGGNDNA